MLEISQGFSRLIELNQFYVHGFKALGSFGLSVGLEGNRNQGTISKVVNLKLAIYDDKNATAIVENVLSDRPLIELNGYAGTERIHFRVLLSSQQFLALESYRESGDLLLTFRLEALVLSEEGAPTVSQSQSKIHIPQQEWIEAMSRSGFQDSYLFEIPLPAGENALKDILLTAQRHINGGDYRNAVMACRRIIEQLEVIRDDKKQAAEANKAVQNSATRKDMNIHQRMLSLREGVKNICQLGAHGTETFSKSQARVILGMTMAMFSEPTIGMRLEESSID